MRKLSDFVRDRRSVISDSRAILAIRRAEGPEVRNLAPIREFNADRSHIAEFAAFQYYIGVGAIGKQGRAAAILRKLSLRRGTGEMGPPNSELWPAVFGRKWGGWYRTMGRFHTQLHTGVAQA